MRLFALAFLLAACGGSGGCEFGAGSITWCQYQSADMLVPGYTKFTDCDGNITVADDYGFVAYGQTASEDWRTMYVMNSGGGFPPIEEGEECLMLPPASLVGRRVLDYSLGRPSQFVLLATEDDVIEFLNR